MKRENGRRMSMDGYSARKANTRTSKGGATSMLIVAALSAMTIPLLGVLVATAVLLLVHVVHHLGTLSERRAAACACQSARIAARHLVCGKSTHCSHCHCADSTLTGWQWIAVLVVLHCLLAARLSWCIHPCLSLVLTRCLAVGGVRRVDSRCRG